MEKFEKFNEVDESNADLIMGEINEFIQLYFFKGNISLSNDKIKNLFDLSHEELIKFKTIHFFLADEVKEFIDILPKLIRNLSHSTKIESEIFKGTVKGRVDWNKTFKERFSRGFDDKTLFICNPPSKYYDLEENQLLKFILKKIVFLKENYLYFISSAQHNLNEFEKTEDWYDIVNINYNVAKKILKKIYFDEIAWIKKVKSKHVRKCYKNRNILYHTVAEVYKLYEKLFIINDEELLKNLVEKRIIKSTNYNKLYEIYIFFKLVELLPGKVDYKLLHSSNDYSLCSCTNDLKITIHYQITPKILTGVSEYLKILEKYKIGGKSRSPDIIIEFEKNGNIWFRLIEIKNSSNPKYIRKSLYKVMGYYKDFKNICFVENFNLTKKYPIILVTWGGIQLKEDYDPFNDEIIILNGKEFLENMDKLLLL